MQHHHAHLAACLAEHGELGPAIGAIFDGTGYGGRRHGVGRGAAVRRPARLRARRVPVPGADAGRRGGDPPAVADGLRVAGGRAGRAAAVACRSTRPPGSRSSELARSGVASPLTTSVGRLFDAVAALCGVRAEVNYEGQAAVELEALLDPAEAGALSAPAARRRRRAAGLDARPTVRLVVDDLRARRGGRPPSPPASTTRSRPPPPRRARGRWPPRHRDRRAVGRGVPEPAPAGAHARAAR